MPCATCQHGLELYLIGLEAENTGNGLMIASLQLAAEAGQGLIAVPSQITMKWLHRRVCEIGEDKLGFDHPAGASQRSFRDLGNSKGTKGFFLL